jgi:hypothetical protein
MANNETPVALVVQNLKAGTADAVPDDAPLSNTNLRPVNLDHSQQQQLEEPPTPASQALPSQQGPSEEFIKGVPNKAESASYLGVQLSINPTWSRENTQKKSSQRLLRRSARTQPDTPNR